MTVVLVLLCGGALLGLFFVARSVLWRRLVSARPVLTVGEAVAAATGTAVIVHGRTAAFPMRPSPLSGRDCVWYEVLKRHTRAVSSNYDETTITVEASWGDLAVYDEHGARMPVTVDLGVRPILAAASPLAGEFPPERATTGGNNDYTTISERLVEPGRPVVVTGVVQPDGMLGRSTWPDGSAYCATSAQLFRRHVRFEWWIGFVAIAFALSAVAVVLTR
jgi:hypothetical protein